MEFALAVFTLAAGLGAITGAVYPIWQALRSRKESTRQENLSEKIERLSKALASAAATVTEIEQEIEKRSELVQQLEQEKAVAEEIVSLSADQVKAVADLLSIPVKRETTRGVWVTGVLTVVSGALFFLFGVLITLVLSG